MIELRVLGTLDLRDREHGAVVGSVLAQPKRIALLCYLALAGSRGAHSRKRLLALFWPDSDDERARNSLNQSVFQLRRSLGEATLAGTAEDVALRDGAIWCDAVEFDAALAARDTDRALELYGGELLPGFHVDGCPEFEHWLDGERERLRRRAVAAALDAAAALENTGNGVAALELLRRAASWAPYEEAPLERLIALLARLGDRSGAIQLYDRFRARYVAELELEPSSAIQALVAEIRRAEPTPPAGPLPPGPERAVAEETPPQSRAGAPTVRARRRIAAPAALAVLVVVLAAGALLRAGAARGRSDSPLADAALDVRRVLVSAFENRTGDPSLDPLGYMAADWIAQGLARTGVARVVPFSTVVQETPYLAAPDAAPEVALRAANRRLARRIGAGTLVVGSYYRVDDEVVLQAQVVDAVSGELLRALDEVRGPAANPAEAVEQLQRRSLGALATLFDERLQSWPDPGGQPASLEAYRRFSEAMGEFMRAMNGHGTPDGRRLYGEAAAGFVAASAADTMFTTALLWAGYAFANAGDGASANRLVGRLEPRSLSPWSRAVLKHQRAALDRDAEAAYQAARELADLSPDSEWLFKLAMSAYQTGRVRESLDVFLRMDPERGWLRGWRGYWHLRAEVRHVLGDHAGALADTRQGLQQDPADGWLRTQELWALAALGRADELVEAVAPRLVEGDVRALWQLATAVEELHGHGRRAAARRLMQRVLPLAEALVARDGGLPARANLAHLLYAAGRDGEAATIYRAAVAARPGQADYRVRLAILDARRGEPGRARETQAWLEALSDEELAHAVPPFQLAYWGSHHGWRALAQAKLLVQLGERDRAVEMLRVALSSGLAHAYMHLHDDADFEPLRGHARFESLLRPRG
jgi:DNA-binding SARP family transcriptional activator/TolB-like protein